MFKTCRLYLYLIIIILIISSWLRFWRLPDIPPGLWRDEAYYAMESVWMVDTLSPQIFFILNDGREPMFQYFGAIFMTMFGATPFTIRLLSAFVGVISIALMYRWLMTLFADIPERYWLSLIAAIGLGFSFWYLVMNRMGYRANLTTPFVILTSLLFWQGWQQKSFKYFISAGIALGLSQYTYLAARLLPLVFVLFALIWSIAGNQHTQKQILWRGLFVMAIVSFIVFLPLGIFFWENPTAFFARGNTTLIFSRVARGEASLIGHLVDSIRLFVDSYDPHWRHNIVGQSGFNWLSLIGFWLGLLFSLKRIRRPQYLFLLIGLFIFWLPTLFSENINVPRLLGLLPFFYAIMSVGLIGTLRLVYDKLSKEAPERKKERKIYLGIFLLIFVISITLTAYNYFVRWANEPGVYVGYDTPLANLIRYLINKSQTTDILLPFDVYAHPTTRFLLYSEFREIDNPPDFSSNRPMFLVNIPSTSPIAYIPNETSFAYVWLSRDREGRGIAYISHPPNPSDLINFSNTNSIENFDGPHTNPIAQLIPIENNKLRYSLSDWQSLQNANYEWNHEAHLIGYEI